MKKKVNEQIIQLSFEFPSENEKKEISIINGNEVNNDNEVSIKETFTTKIISISEASSIVKKQKEKDIIKYILENTKSF